MGKLLILLVLSITIAFSTISLTVQHRTGEVTDLINEQLSQIQSKNLGQYALNYGIKQVQEGKVTGDFIHYINLDVQNGSGTINSIKYYFSNDTILIITNVSWTSGDTTLSHQSETKLVNSWVQPEDQVGWWSMNDGYGSTATDSSSELNHGNLTNMDTTGSWVSGRVGGALEFDGSNDFVDLSLIGGIYDNIITLTSWVQFEPAFLNADWGVILSEQNPTEWGTPNPVWSLRTRLIDIFFGFFAQAKYAFTVSNGYYKENVQLNLDNWWDGFDVFNWHFIAGIYNGPQGKIEVGVVDENIWNEKNIPVNFFDPLRSDDNPVSIGGMEITTGFPFIDWFGDRITSIEAKLDEVRIIAGDLSKAKLLQLSQNNAVNRQIIYYWLE